MHDEPCICTGLRQAAHAATAIYDRALEPSGLKITMYRVLRRLSRSDGPTITELARIVDLDRSSLGRNLRVLERQNLVRFADGEDERSKVVRLTPKGRAALDKATPLWAKAQKTMSELLGHDKHAVFAIQSKVDAEMAAAAP
jgi:DNA-binding MarR family transcriptional regulator